MTHRQQVFNINMRFWGDLTFKVKGQPTSSSFVGMKKGLNVLQTQNSAKIYLQEPQNNFKRIYLFKRLINEKNRLCE